MTDNVTLMVEMFMEVLGKVELLEWVRRKIRSYNIEEGRGRSGVLIIQKSVSTKEDEWNIKLEQ